MNGASTSGKDPRSSDEALRPKGRIVTRIRDNSEFHNILNAKQLQFNKNWLIDNFARTSYVFIPNSMTSQDSVKVPTYFNESNLFPGETEPGSIDPEQVKMFLGQGKIDSNNFALIKDTIPNTIQYYDQKMKRLPNLRFKNLVQLTIGTFPNNFNSQYGYIAIFDPTTLKIVSAAMPFLIVGQIAKFPQTEQDSIYFPFTKDLRNYHLLFVIYGTTETSYKHQTMIAMNSFPFCEKGNFISRTTFPTKFINIIDNSFEETLKALVDRSRATESDATIEFEIKKLPAQDQKSSICYPWSIDYNGMLVVNILKHPSVIPSPFILLSNIKISWKPSSRYTHFCFKAYYFQNTDSIGTPPGVAAMLNQQNSKYDPCFESTILPVSAEMSFPDVVQIAIGNHEPCQTSHIILYVYGYGPKDLNGTVTAIVVLPMFVDGIPIPSGEDYFAYHESKKLSKNYFKKPKSHIKDPKNPGKTFMKCDVLLPHAFFVPTKLLFYKDADFSTISKQSLIENVLPLIVKFFASDDIADYKKFYDLFRYIGVNENVLNDIYKWLYDGFDPKSLDNEGKESSYVKICENFSQIIEEGLTLKDDNDELFDFLKTSEMVVPIILTAAMVCLHYPMNKKYNEAHFVKLATSVCKLIAKHMNIVREYPPYERPKKLKKGEEFKKPPPKVRDLDAKFLQSGVIKMIDSLAETILNCISFLSSTAIYTITVGYIKSVNYEANFSNELRNMVYIQIRFLSKITSSKLFTRSFAIEAPLQKEYKATYVPYNYFISTLFKDFMLAFAMDSTFIIDAVSAIFIQIVLSAEELDPEIRHRAAVAILPLLNLLYENFNNHKIKQNPDLQYKYILCTMFIFGAAPVEASIYFYGLETTFKLKFLNFMIYCGNIMVEKGRESPEMLHVFVNYSQNVLLFLSYAARYSRNVYQEFVNLMSVFTNELQPSITLIDNQTCFISYNMLLINNVLKRVIKEQTLYAVTCKWILPLTQRKQHFYREFVAASLFQIYKEDYRKTGKQQPEDYARPIKNNITLSSVETLDSLTNTMFNLTDEQYTINYINLVRSLKIDQSPFIDPTLQKKITERAKNAEVVFACILEQKKSTLPPDQLARSIMRIADEYKDLPSMRMQWLQQIVRKNKEAHDLISAFIAQIHVVALSCHVFQSRYNLENDKDFYLTTRMKSPDQKSDDSVTKWNLLFTQPRKQDIENEIKDFYFDMSDFDFSPDARKEFEIFYEPEVLRSSLLNEIDMRHVINVCTEAIQIGRAAHMNYSLRPLYSFILRMCRRLRDSATAAKFYQEYSEDEVKIESNDFYNRNGGPDGVHFYMIEDKQHSQRTVYTSNLQIDEFVTMMKQYYPNLKSCPYHTDNCTRQGTCIIEIVPYEDMTASIERRHTYTSFKSVIEIKTNESVIYTKQDAIELFIETEENSPHYAQSVAVKTVTPKSSKANDYIIGEVNRAQKRIDDMSDELESVLPDNENKVNIEFFDKDIERITNLIKEFSKDYYVVWNYIKDAERTSMINSLRNSFQRLMRVFARFIRNAPSKFEEKWNEMFEESRSNLQSFFQRLKCIMFDVTTSESVSLDPMRELGFTEYGGI